MQYTYKLIVINTKGVASRNIDVQKAQDEINEAASQGWELMETQRIDSNGWTDRLVFILRKSVV